jgi:hypothetical protein
MCHLCKEEFLDQDIKARHPCPVKLKVKATLDALEHNEQGKLTCPGCSQSYRLMLALRQHYLTTHAETGPEAQTVSTETMLRKSKQKKISAKAQQLQDSLLESNNVLEEMNSGPFLCEQCPFIGNKVQLALHVGLSHKDRKFDCDYCSFSTDSKVALSKHIKKDHVGKPWHICYACDVSYRYE